MTQHGQEGLSRRAMLHAAIVAAAVGYAGIAQGQQQQQPQKVDKKLVVYQPTPKNGQACNQCVNFQPPNACKLVAGDISPAGWCMLFAAKPA